MHFTAPKSGFKLRKSVAAVAIGLVSAAALADTSVTLYGTVDVNFTHQTLGAPSDPNYPGNLLYSIQSAKASRESINALASNAMSQSKIGFKGLTTIDDEWSGLFTAETYFNPSSGALSDGPKSLVNNAGLAASAQDSSGDSSKAGQIFGVAYAGLTSKNFGTLTFGRQTTLMLDNIVAYDAFGGSNAFSIIGYSGVAGGAGDTEDARLDNTVKYVSTVGIPDIGTLRIGSLVQFPGLGGSKGTKSQVDLGGVFGDKSTGVFSTDIVYAKMQDAISLGALNASQADIVNAAATAADTTANAALSYVGTSGSVSNSLAATVSDNTALAVMGKYTTGALALFAGYENITYKNPSSQTAVPAGSVAINGYIANFVNYNAYANQKTLKITWLGAKYDITPELNIGAAYYHYDQNSYKGNGCSNASASSCSGQLDAYSIVADYTLSKQLDTYAGFMYSKVSNGLANGFASLNGGTSVNTMDPTVGLRFKF